MEYRNLSELVKYEGNPRTINERQFKILCESIKENPEYFEARPLILSDRTGELVIIAGNQRYEAAKALGLVSVPTFLIEGLTEEKEREIVIRDNVQNGEWDMEALANVWSELPILDWGVDIPKWAEFIPNENPSINTEEVTKEQIEQRAKELAEQMIREQKVLEIVCPSCGEEFSVSL